MLLLIATPELIELGGGKWRLGGLVPPILMVEWTLGLPRFTVRFILHLWSYFLHMLKLLDGID